MQLSCMYRVYEIRVDKIVNISVVDIYLTDPHRGTENKLLLFTYYLLHIFSASWVQFDLLHCINDLYREKDIIK